VPWRERQDGGQEEEGTGLTQRADQT
jgi:hypothetical protein